MGNNLDIFKLTPDEKIALADELYKLAVKLLEQAVSELNQRPKHLKVVK